MRRKFCYARQIEMTKLPSSDLQSSFRQIEPVSVRAQVIAALKDAFFSGRLKPGESIVERKLAKEMSVGTPTVREALVSLHEQGFVRRVANTATYVTKFTPEEVEKLEHIRVELEVLALQWAKPRVTDADLRELDRKVDLLVEAGEQGDARRFLECDLAFHQHCWTLSGNEFLVDMLKRLVSPLSAFVVLGSDVTLTGAMGREHYSIVHALRKLEEPEFTQDLRKTFGGFAARWTTAISDR